MADFVPNQYGLRNLRNSSGVQKDLLARAERIAHRAESASTVRGARYEADVQPGVNRAHAIAHTANVEAMVDQLRAKTLTIAIDAGR